MVWYWVSASAIVWSRVKAAGIDDGLILLIVDGPNIEHALGLQLHSGVLSVSGSDSLILGGIGVLDDLTGLFEADTDSAIFEAVHDGLILDLSLGEVLYSSVRISDWIRLISVHSASVMDLPSALAVAMISLIRASPSVTFARYLLIVGGVVQ